MPQMMDVALLTPQETADLLTVTKGTLEVWRCEKRYPLDYIKIGGKVRYRLMDVEKFLASRIVKGDGPTLVAQARRRRRRTA